MEDRSDVNNYVTPKSGFVHKITAALIILLFIKMFDDEHTARALQQTE